MMRVRYTTGLLLLLAGTLYAAADDPCQVAGIGGRFDVNSNRCVEMPGTNGGTAAISPLQLLARIIVKQDNEMNELKTAIASLATAVQSLQKISTDLVASDQKWKADSLDKTINAVDKMPATLAAEKTLQAILIAAVKEQLIKDPTFLEAVKKAP